MIAELDRRSHRAFLNRTYGVTRGAYDASRRFFLLGRDRAIDQLLSEPWVRLVEVGPGTGRNLLRLHSRRPEAVYGGLDACDAMLELARARCPWARFVHAFGEDADYGCMFGGQPDRIFFSYALSMFCDPGAALERARRSLAPGGKVVAVDFGDFAALPKPCGSALRAWLAAFRVSPVDLDGLRGRPVEHTFGRGRYYAIATFESLETTARGGQE